MASGWQPVNVEVAYPTKDPPRPRAFTWQGYRLRIADLGRCWEDEDGLHRLARALDGRTFELVRERGMWRARVIATPPGIV
jgi:hypothetical protein